MTPNELAAWLDSYHASARSALQRAARDGYRRIHANASRGELSAPELTASGRRHLRRYLADLGIRLDGMALPLPGAGLADAATADSNLQQLRDTLGLCRELGVSQASVRLGGFDDPQNAALAGELLATVADLADRADIDVNVYSDVDQTGSVLSAVDALRCPQLHAALDPAALGREAAQVIGTASSLGALFLRDARVIDGGVEEVRFGEGDVDFASVLAATQALGRPVGLIVRRRPTGDVDAMRQGYEYMSTLLREPSAQG